MLPSLPFVLSMLEPSFPSFEGLVPGLKVINVPAKKADYYMKRLPEELHKLIVELPAEKKVKK